MSPSRSETELRRRARELIRQRRLPTTSPATVWAGMGTGLPCALCAQVVRQDEVEYELEYAGELRPAQGASLYRFHFHCHRSWQLERAATADT